jgi:hypothetical protein
MKLGMDREVIMNTPDKLKICIGIILILAVAALVSAPALAADKSKSDKKDKDDVVTSVAKITPENHETMEAILTGANGPPINPYLSIYTLYYKIIPGKGNDMTIYKLFKKGHPNENSLWLPYHL